MVLYYDSIVRSGHITSSMVPTQINDDKLMGILCSMLRKEVRTEGLWLRPGWRRPAERLLRQWVGFQAEKGHM